MIILTIKTDQPEAEIGLYDDAKKLAGEKWLAHRQLSDTLLAKIDELCKSQKVKAPDGLVVFQGPGSFTGLRIGLTVANTISYGFSAQIVGAKGEDWIKKGITSLLKGENDGQILPFYGGEAHITKPRK